MMFNTTFNQTMALSSAALIGLAGMCVPASAFGQTHSESTTISRLGDQTIKVTESNGDVEVYLDGKKLDLPELDTDWTSYEVRDENNELVATLKRFDDGFGGRTIAVLMGNGTAGALTDELTGSLTGSWSGPASPNAPSRPLRLRGAPDATSLWFTRIEQPKVMMGITMDAVEEQQGRELGLEPESGVIITRVYDDLPADKAGLQTDDIVISIDGVSPATLATIRDTLSRKQPGDTIDLKVLRDGRHQSLTITLEAYDGQALGAPRLPGLPMAEAPPEMDFLIETIIDPELEEHLAVMSDRIRELASQMAEDPARAAELARQMEVLSSELAELSAKRAGSRAMKLNRGEAILKLFGQDPYTLGWAWQGQEEDEANAPDNFFLPNQGSYGLGNSPFPIDEQAMERLVEAQRRAAELLEQRSVQAEELYRRTIEQLERANQVKSGEAEVEERLERLDDRLERLEAMLEKLLDEQRTQHH